MIAFGKDDSLREGWMDEFPDGNGRGKKAREVGGLRRVRKEVEKLRRLEDKRSEVGGCGTRGRETRDEGRRDEG